MPRLLSPCCPIRHRIAAILSNVCQIFTGAARPQIMAWIHSYLGQFSDRGRNSKSASAMDTTEASVLSAIIHILLMDQLKALRNGRIARPEAKKSEMISLCGSESRVESVHSYSITNFITLKCSE